MNPCADQYLGATTIVAIRQSSILLMYCTSALKFSFLMGWGHCGKNPPSKNHCDKICVLCQ